MPLAVVTDAQRFEVLRVVLTARLVVLDGDPVMDVELGAGAADGAAASGPAAGGGTGEGPDVGLVERDLAARGAPAGPVAGEGLPVPPAATLGVRAEREGAGRRVDGLYRSGTGNDRVRSHTYRIRRGGPRSNLYPQTPVEERRGMWRRGVHTGTAEVL